MGICEVVFFYDYFYCCDYVCIDLGGVVVEFLL